MPVASILAPPTVARDYIVSLLHWMPKDEGVDRIVYGDDKIVLEGPNPANALSSALYNIAGHLDRAEVKKIPASGNDSKILEKVYRCIGSSGERKPGDIIRDAASNIATILERRIPNECRSFKMPSILKPEVYEHNRSPGYIGSRKLDDEIPIDSIMLSIAGYLSARAGYTEVSRNAVLIIPDIPWTAHEPTIVLRDAITALYDKSRNRRPGTIPGTTPEPSFILWLSFMLSDIRRISRVKIYQVSEPAGMSAAAIKGSIAIDLEKLRRNEIWLCLASRENWVQDILGLLELSLSERNRSERAVRVSIALYEAIEGVRSVEEFYYLATRDYLSVKLQHSEPSKDIYLSYRVAEAVRICYQKTASRGL